MTDVKIPQSRIAQADRRPSRGLLVASVVALAIVVAGFVLLDGPGDREQTELAAPVDTPVDLAYRIIEARNAFDADALADVLGSALYEGNRELDELIPLMQWREAYDWRLVDPTCEQTTVSSVVCSYTVTNRLTRHAGLEGEVDGTMYLIYTSGALSSVSEEFNIGQYSTRAFEPFRSWVNQNHGGAAEKMWDTSLGAISPQLTDESIRLFDEMLTEYTGEG